jgi:hypothetical protein
VRVRDYFIRGRPAQILIGALLAVFVAAPNESRAADPVLAIASNSYPVGTTVSQVRQIFLNEQSIPVDLNVTGMSGFIFVGSPGSPIFYFCHDILTSYTTSIDDPTVVLFRRLVDDNSRTFGAALLKLDGNVDALGREWASVIALWRLHARTLTTDFTQQSGGRPSIQLWIIDPNPCLGR